MNASDTLAVIAYLGSAFPNFDPSDDTIDVWVNELEDIDPADANEAMHNLVRSSEFAPTIAKFRAECRTVGLHRQRQVFTAAGLPRGEMAWPKELVDDLKAALAEQAKKARVKT